MAPYPCVRGFTAGTLRQARVRDAPVSTQRETPLRPARRRAHSGRICGWMAPWWPPSLTTCSPSRLWAAISKVSWITRTMLDFPARGAPFRITIWPGIGCPCTAYALRQTAIVLARENPQQVYIGTEGGSGCTLAGKSGRRVTAAWTNAVP